MLITLIFSFAFEVKENVASTNKQYQSYNIYSFDRGYESRWKDKYKSTY